MNKTPLALFARKVLGLLYMLLPVAAFAFSVAYFFLRADERWTYPPSPPPPSFMDFFWNLRYAFTRSLPLWAALVWPVLAGLWFYKKPLTFLGGVVAVLSAMPGLYLALLLRTYGGFAFR